MTPLKLMLLGAGSVIHTQRWANGLADAGVQVLCVSQHAFMASGWSSTVERHRLPHGGPLGYFLNGGAVRRLFRSTGCQLLNAHYATGYGMTATLSGVHPRLVSVWGSDVFDFPRTSKLHLAMVRWVLGRADRVASTSEVMARQVRSLMGERGLRAEVALTPFGVDTQRFVPLEEAMHRVGDRAAWISEASQTTTGARGPAGVRRVNQDEVSAPPPRPVSPLVIGTVKVLAPKYGIDTLIRAVALLVARLPDAALPQGLRLRLVGDGPQRAELERLVEALGIATSVEFIGAVDHADVPRALQAFDIFAAASRLDSESFGVAVIEASACGLPVVVSDAGGLPEVVVDGETGLVVKRDDPGALADALLRLCIDPSMRARLGGAGRGKVERDYEWRGCVARMVDVMSGMVA
ncbi:MAG: hypothetical protein JWQ11_391 [Rhizobacter sp.]|nr:hypothetical protein [Rhizobacter sp.]